jgi:hypothetical protein
MNFSSRIRETRNLGDFFGGTAFKLDAVKKSSPTREEREGQGQKLSGSR